MDLIKIQLEKLSRGHVTSFFGIVVMRRADRYIFGESINIKSHGVSLDDAAKGIYELSRM